MKITILAISLILLIGCTTLADIRHYDPLLALNSPNSPETVAYCISSQAAEEMNIWTAAYDLPVVNKLGVNYQVLVSMGNTPACEIVIKPEGTGSVIEARGRWFMGRDRIIAAIYRCVGPKQ